MSVDQLLAWNDRSVNQMGAFLSEKISDCASIDFLTGYFFFDGLKEIQQALLANPFIKLRILVGMDAGIDTSGLVHRVYEREDRESARDAANDYLARLKDILGHWEPGKVKEAQVKLWNQYAGMIEEGRLEIRKTQKPNHAKIYIFHHQNGAVTYTGGSSNFSYSGLAGRNEFNIHVSEQFTTEVYAIFEKLWQEALPIVDFTTHKGTSELAKTLREDSPGSAILPFDAYMKIMSEYLKLNRSDEKLENRIRAIIRSVGYDELKYQIDAVSRAKKILDSNGGVVIADVVGLGKSVVASLLAKLSDGPGVVLAPPSLIEGVKGWKSYLDKFSLAGMGWKAFSTHNTDLAKQPEVRTAWTVIIDEAHNLRNENTDLYENLQKLVVGKRVICLSATPYNNRPGDLLSLIKLFSSPKIAGESKAEFTGKIEVIAKKHKGLIAKRRALTGKDLVENSEALKTLAKELRLIIYPLTIRRNRIDLLKNEEYKKEVGDRMPELMPPINCKAELTAEQGQFYEAILTEYFAGEHPSFKGAMYHPQTYITSKDKQAQRQTNLYSMICRFMVSRWESSPVAFYKTLENISASLKTSLKMLNDHGIFFRGLEEYDGGENDGDLPGAGPAAEEYADLIKQIKKTKKTLPVYVTQAVKSRVQEELFGRKDVFSMTDKQIALFKADLHSDLAVLQDIQQNFIASGLGALDSQESFQAIPENDGKLQALVKLLKDIFDDQIGKDSQEPGNPRKVIVFSYYADTARYVCSYLEQKFPGKLLYADGDTKTIKYKLEIEWHFMSLKPSDEGYQESLAKKPDKMILVCTDVLSEGINLNQGGVVVNYDISYNPVRVIQRRGRINRIDQKVFERLYNVNFFPTAQGENINRIGDISIRKMKMIHSILGEDACILSDEEDPKAFMDGITDTNTVEEEMVSDETRVANLFQQGLAAKYGTDEKAKAKYKAHLDAIGRGHWTKICGECNQLYVFKQNTAAFFVTRLPNIANEQIPAERVSCFEAFKAIQCLPGVSSLAFSATDSDPFWKAYQRFISGNSFVHQNQKLSQKQLEALDVVNAFSKEIQNKATRMIRTDNTFARNILSCEENEENIAKLLEETEENNRKLTTDNSIEVLFVGIKTGDKE